MKGLSFYVLLAMFAFFIGFKSSQFWSETTKTTNTNQILMAAAGESPPFNDEGPGRPHR